MGRKFNIVIPSIELSEELIHCLQKLNQQTYKNFFVTIVLDFKNKKKKPRLNYKLKILISNNKNMSFKRNLGVKKFKSETIAFLDSDAYPHKNWLKNATYLLSKKINEKNIIGGPSIPFPKQSYSEMLCHYAKRSFYLTGYLNFRKYKSKSRYCDWIESCCMFVNRALYLKHGGMNIKKYLGEDKNLIEKIKKNDSSVKVFFTPKLFIYHKERNIRKFLFQRMAYGSDLFNIIKFQNKISSFQPILPFFVMITGIVILLIEINIHYNYFLIGSFIILIQLMIFMDIKKYLVNFKTIFLTLILINIANISYVIGNLLAIFGIKNIINRRIYILSRSTKLNSF